MNPITSRRIPWVALALSLLSAGVGHLYCGRVAKGLPLYFAWLAVPACVTLAAFLPPSATSLSLLMLLPVVVVLIVYLYAAVDAWRLAERTGSDYEIRDYNRLAVYGLLVGVQLVYAIGLTAGVRGFVYEAFVIPTKSMSPTILSGDRILARKLLPAHHFPERGDLIVYRNPSPQGGDQFLSRVVAVAGDKIEVSGKRILINGDQLKKDRVPMESLSRFGKGLSGDVEYEVNSGRRYLVAYDDEAKAAPEQRDFSMTVPDRQVFVLGDNRDRARDSRHLGAIHLGDIIGYADYLYWPSASWSRFGTLNR